MNTFMSAGGCQACANINPRPLLSVPASTLWQAVRTGKRNGIISVSEWIMIMNRGEQGPRKLKLRNGLLPSPTIDLLSPQMAFI